MSDGASKRNRARSNCRLRSDEPASQRGLSGSETRLRALHHPKASPDAGLPAIRSWQTRRPTSSRAATATAFRAGGVLRAGGCRAHGAPSPIAPGSHCAAAPVPEMAPSSHAWKASAVVEALASWLLLNHLCTLSRSRGRLVPAIRVRPSPSPLARDGDGRPWMPTEARGHDGRRDDPYVGSPAAF